MNLNILQIGAIINTPPIISGIFATVGFSLLVLWHVHFHQIPFIASNNSFTQHEKARIVAPIVLGVLLTGFGMVIRFQIVWIVFIIFFAIGRAIEGGVAVWTYRRISYYLSRISYLGRGKTNKNQNFGSIGRLLLRRLVYRIVSVVVIIIAVTMTTIIIILSSSPLTYSLPFIWATVVSTTTVFTFLWDTRNIVNNMHSVPLVGLLCCILSAELYNFTYISIPPSAQYSINMLLMENLIGDISTQNIMNFFSTQQLPTEYIFAYILGWISYAGGIIFSIIIIFNNNLK